MVLLMLIFLLTVLGIAVMLYELPKVQMRFNISLKFG